MTFFVFHTILSLNSMKRDFSVRSLILAIIIVFSIERTYAEEEFDQWIEAFRKEALKKI